MKVDTFYRPNWEKGLLHHIWLTGSMKELRAAQRWVTKHVKEHGITLVSCGPEQQYRACILDKVKKPDTWRVILMTTQPIDPIILKLSVTV